MQDWYGFINRTTTSSDLILGNPFKTNFTSTVNQLNSFSVHEGSECWPEKVF